jgi:hypothetical protein
VWLAAQFELPGTLDDAAFRRALSRFVERHDGLHTGFEVSDKGAERVIFSPAKVAFELSSPVAVDDSESLRGLLRERFTAECDPLTAPAYMFATVEHEGYFSVFASFDHTLVDAISLAIVVADLAHMYEEEINDTSEPLPKAGSFMEYCVLENERKDEPISQEILDEYARFFEAAGGTPPVFPLDLGVAPGEVAPQGADMRDLLDTDATERFALECKEQGVSVFTGTMTAMAMAVHQMGGPEKLPLQFPLHTRREPQWAKAVGWLTTGGPMIACGDGDFATSAPQTHVSFRDGLRLSASRMSEATAALGDAVQRTHTDTFMVSYIDYRAMASEEACSMLSAHHISNVTVADNAQFWISRTESGLSLRSRFPDTEQGRATMAEFLTRVEVILAGQADALAPELPFHVAAAEPHRVLHEV